MSTVQGTSASRWVENHGVSIAGTAEEERKHRKKIQNRVNQRAFRSRNPKANKTNAKAKHHQYQIGRWRLDEEQIKPVAQGSPDLAIRPGAMRAAAAHNSSDQDVRQGTVQEALDQSSTAIWFPLPADHLLHLIKYNVFRGLCENKAMVSSLTLEHRPPGSPSGATCDHADFPGYSVILPTAPHCSGYLTPTPVQMNVIHSTWINMLPFPTMRDNLIKWERDFSHFEFVRDLVGDLIDLRIFPSTTASSGPIFAAGLNSLDVDDDDDSTANQTGLIVWGEPHLANSWEATPDFLQKWGWAVVDCRELIESTNYWRRSRGDRPFPLPLAP